MGKLVSIGYSFAEINTLSAGPADDEISAFVIEMLLVGAANIFILLFAAIAFLMWFHRVHRNQPALGNHRVKYTPGWSVGYWFIPIVNLFRPVQAMGEAWRGSDPADLGRPLEMRPGTPLIGFWWAAWLIGTLGERGFGRMEFRASMRGHLETELFAIKGGIAAEAVLIVAGILVIALIRAITDRQDARFEARRAL